MATINTNTYWNFNAKPKARAPRPARIRVPPKPLSIDYPPLNAQPEYAVEFQKFTRFTAERQQATKSLEALQVQASQRSIDNEQKETNALSKAESLLAGDLPYNLQNEIDKASKLIAALDAAIDVQRGVLSRIEESLSRVAGRRYADDHKEAVRRIMVAATELHAANEAEKTLRSDLQSLGYGGATVPPMNLFSVDNPFDTTGNITYYWYRDAARYVQTDAQLAAAVREARVAGFGA